MIIDIEKNENARRKKIEQKQSVYRRKKNVAGYVFYLLTNYQYVAFRVLLIIHVMCHGAFALLNCYSC